MNILYLHKINSKVKQIKFTLLTVFVYFMVACSSTNGDNKSGMPVSIKGELENAPSDTVRLYDFYGPELIELGFAILSKDKKSSFEIKSKIPCAGMYYVGFGPQKGKFIILKGNDNVKLIGDAMFLAQTGKLENSPETQEFEDYMKSIQTAQQTIQQMQQGLSKKDPKSPEYASDMKTLDSLLLSQYAVHESKVKNKNVLGKIASMYLYKPFKPETNGKYKDELEYFKAEFISSINFGDTTLAYIPQVYEKVSYFVGTLAQIVPLEEATKICDEMLAKIPAKSKLKPLMYYSIFGATQGRSQDLFINFGEKYVKEYPSGFKSKEIKDILAKSGSVKIGSAAPEIDLPGIDGKNRKLSSLKGKVVLIDFWASWCGPCRKENPNVIKAYQKYHPKGFEIFSVSLDNNADKWKEAIKTDGLIWPDHVSDLKGWQTVTTQTYQYNSIPFTVLIDKEGKIIAKGLRGPQLEAKLAELLK